VSAYAHVCCAVDGAPARADALRLARAVAGEGARLSVVHVTDPRPVMGPETPTGPDGAGGVEGARAWLEGEAAGVGGDPVLLVDEDPAASLAGWAATEGVDLIVAAAHHDRLERAFVGSFTRDVAHAAPCAVLVARPGVPAPQGPPDLVVACVDEASGARVVDECRALAGRRLALLHVAGADGLAGLLPGSRSGAEAEVPAWLAGMRDAVGAAEAHVIHGRGAGAAEEWAAERGAQVVAAAARVDPGPVALLGSFTTHLVHHARAHVLVARPPASPGAAAPA